MNVIVFTIIALCVGIMMGWLFGAMRASRMAAERDMLRRHYEKAVQDFERVDREREGFQLEAASLRAREAGFADRIAELQQAREAMADQFRAVSADMLERAQAQFLERAEDRFRQSEEMSGSALRAMLQPVSERLQQYEDQVARVENERREAYGSLQGLMQQMREGQDLVRSEAARLVNSLRNAPKARGRWGEQQLRNVLENCGLSEFADFQTEVSHTTDDGTRMRPDVIVRVPGGKALVIDAKVSLNAYQDAFLADSDSARKESMAAHAAAMKAHVNALGNKAYQDQFADTPDYVVMFIPGEHFLAAALEHDPDLWDFAFNKRVLLATPTNLIAIARTVAAVWRQEAMAKEARQIAALGKEMYERLRVAGAHLGNVGKGLTSAVKHYNSFVSSFESRVMVTGRKLADKHIETGGHELVELDMLEISPRLTDSGSTDNVAPDRKENA